MNLIVLFAFYFQGQNFIFNYFLTIALYQLYSYQLPNKINTNYYGLM